MHQGGVLLPCLCFFSFFHFFRSTTTPPPFPLRILHAPPPPGPLSLQSPTTPALVLLGASPSMAFRSVLHDPPRLRYHRPTLAIPIQTAKPQPAPCTGRHTRGGERRQPPAVSQTPSAALFVPSTALEMTNDKTAAKISFISSVPSPARLARRHRGHSSYVRGPYEHTIPSSRVKPQRFCLALRTAISCCFLGQRLARADVVA